MSDRTGQVAIGYVHPSQVAALFMRSILLTRDNIGPVQIFSVMSGPNISKARNMVVRTFLDRSPADYLFMCDTDMMFNDDAIERLMDSGESFISGFCMTGEERPVPAMYRGALQEGTFCPITEWPTDEIIDVDAVGSACSLIHRSVYETVERELPNKAAQWYQEQQYGDYLVGEDFTFCMRARKCGFKIKVDTSVKVAHIKPHTIGKAA
jgi:GT2 family glycosyltransferase